MAWISHYAVNVPVGDEWAMVPLFEKWHSGQLTFRDLYQQHNEHRIVIPKLIYLAFAQLTNWNLRAEMFFSVAVCAGTSVGIYILLRRTLGGRSRQVLLLWAAANLLIFSPMQAQNWLSGFQLPMFIPNLCLVTALVIFTAGAPGWPQFGAAVFVVAAATFSFASSLLLWPLLALFLALRGADKWKIAAWLLVFGVVAALYLVDYHRVPAPQPVTWLDYPGYFLVFIGGALARGREGELLLGPLVAGAVALAVYAASCVYFLRTRREVLREAAPWLALGLYVIGSAALATYSRVNWGPRQAMDTRYVTSSSLLYVCLIALAAIAARYAGHRSQRVADVVRATKPTLITTIVILTLATFPAGLQEMATLQRQQLAGLGALQFSHVIDTTDYLRRDLKMIPGFVPEPSRYVAALERLNLLHFRPRNSPVLKDARRGSKRARLEFGSADEFKHGDTASFEISGWAVLPKQGRPAPLVVLAYLDGDQWIAFALADVWEFRDDVVARLRSRRYQPCGWRKTINRGTMPPHAERISGWAVDPLANEVHQLAGDYALPAL